MNDNVIYLDTYVLQQDMRIRLPKAIVANLGLAKGISQFDIYLDIQNKELILKLNEDIDRK